ncbi:Uncharacterised protein [Bordetella pertussis]|nr:Uncharacterised protein [Bordetella pertussis]CFW49368.1 Uncharacterised protein [Bordetella pertussis]
MAAGISWSNVAAMWRAMSGLSITKPSSVLRLAERGSKLNEPMKTRSPSTPKVLACRLDPELPNRPLPCGLGPA